MSDLHMPLELLCYSRRPLEREPPKNSYRDTLFSFAVNCFNHYRALYSEGSFHLFVVIKTFYEHNYNANSYSLKVTA